MTEDKGPLAKFLEKKFIEWSNQLGQIKRQSEFAAYLSLDAASFKVFYF